MIMVVNPRVCVYSMMMSQVWYGMRLLSFGSHLIAVFTTAFVMNTINIVCIRIEAYIYFKRNVVPY